jgi:hypothetical protein
VHDTQESCSGHIAGKATDDPALEIDDEGVAEAFCHEGNPLVVGREVGPFAEICEDLDVPGQVVEWAALFSLRRDTE